MPEDTPETNPLLKENAIPPFSELTDRQCVMAVGKLLIEHEMGVSQLNERLTDLSLPKTVQSVILPLDQLTVPLDFAWATFKLLASLNQHKSISQAYVKLHARIQAARREQYISPFIHNAFKELKASERCLAEPVRRVVDKHLLESDLSGMNLTETSLENFSRIVRKLNEHKSKYSHNLAVCTSKIAQPLVMNDVKNFPEDFVKAIAENPSRPLDGPWKVTMEPHIYQNFMEYCDNRLLRWNVWRTRHVRASFISGSLLNNSLEMEEIRFHRHEQAKLLGFQTFVDLSMKTKMAGSVENVMAMLTTLRIRSRDSTIKEIRDLQDFVSESGYDIRLELWDIPFWQRKHKEKLFGLDHAAVRQYFPYPAVLKGLFEFCRKLFGVNIVEATSEVSKWHEDVSYYKIYDENEVPIASFFIDPYERPGEKIAGEWMEIGRNRSDVVGAEPLAYLGLNLSPPQMGKPSMLSFNELRMLLQKFGHVLQHSLTTVPYSDVAGLSNLEWDTVNVCPLFMSQWLCDYDTVASMSSYVDSGKPLPPELHDRLWKAHQYMAGLRLTEELYLAALDIELYTRKQYWVDVMRKVWAEYMLFPLEKDQAHVCSFSQIFVGEFPAAYFSLLWSEMIAADLFSAFQEVGLSNKEAINQIGRRFRETYLSLGGGCHPSEVFRRFRGRDPSTDALLSKCGMNKKSTVKLEE